MLTVLLQHSFLVGMVETLGLQASRFNLFAQLVQQVPVRRLTYPTGVENLPLVNQAILEDLATLQSTM